MIQLKSSIDGILMNFLTVHLLLMTTSFLLFHLFPLWNQWQLALIEGVENALAQLSNGKSPGMDGLSPEICRCGGPKFMQRLTNLLVNVWMEECVLQEWKDALGTVPYKGKSAKDDYGNYRGIDLLCTAGKMHCIMILDLLQCYITNEVLPVSVWLLRWKRYC